MKKKVAAKGTRVKAGGKGRDLPARKNPRGGVSTTGYVIPCVKIRTIVPCVKTI